MRYLIIIAVLSLIVLAATFADIGPATMPTSPAAAQTVDPQAAKLLDAMSGAYGKLKSLSVTGTLNLKLVIGDKPAEKHSDFTGSFAAPLLFHHEIKDDTVIAGTGEKVYAYLPAENTYTVEDSPASQAGSPGKLANLSSDVRGVLEAQDLSLAMALAGNAAEELKDGADSVALAPDVVIDGKKYPAVLLSAAPEDITLVLDPDTHLIRRVIADKTRGLKQRDPDVTLGRVTLDYTRTIADAGLKPEQFAFAPPPTAQEAKVEGATASALVGKAAPKFRATLLDGGEISDADLKGSVTVLDFWATWCPACVESLPGLDEIYKSHKADGVKIFAVNLDTEAGKAKEFVASTKLSIPVLLDADGKVGEAYGAELIPETVVIGRDGIVRNVFLGANHEDEINAAIKAAQAGQ